MTMMGGFVGFAGPAIIYSTWNPADKTASMVLSNGNLTASNSSATFQGVRNIVSYSSGKYYFEVTANTVNNSQYIGIATATWVKTVGGLGTNDAVSAGYQSFGNLYANSGAAIAATVIIANDVISVAVDVTNHLIYWAHNGTWQNTANPGAGTGGVNYITTSAVFPAFATGNVASANQSTLNVGASAFTYTIPAGFTAWQ